MDRSIGQIDNLLQGKATAADNIMALAAVDSCHVWLGLLSWLCRLNKQSLWINFLDSPMPQDTGGFHHK